MIDVIDLFNVCLYIQDHLEADLSLLFFARTVGLSRFRFHRVFKAWRGETLHEFVTRMRMERAAFELSYPLPRSSKRSIKTIAFASGYKSLSSFSHAFSAYASLSPREFRNRALRARPVARPNEGGAASLGRFSIAVREEPAHEIALFDPVTRACNAMGPAGRAAFRESAWRDSDFYGLELLPNLFVRSRCDRALSERSAPMSCVGVHIDDWRQAVKDKRRGAPAYAPRTTIKLDAGRHAVLQGHGSIASIYRAWRRGFDDWLAITGECPRPGRIYMRFVRPEDDEGSRSDARSDPYLKPQLAFTLYIPLEERPAAARGGRSAHRKEKRAASELTPNSSEPIGPST
ncbi:MAG: helix-turn-helix domain-containing protein, partial [Burkholderiaceae bacterium]